MDFLAALKLQIEWGVDEALEDAPVDRLTPVRAAAPAPSLVLHAGAMPRPVPAASPGPRMAAVARAQAAAAGANTLEALYSTMAAFRDCPLAITATSLAVADGNALAGLVVVGEAAGAEEDRTGRPFKGPAGQLLDRMLDSIGLTRADLLLTDLVPWRPPGGRAPTDTEIQICAPFLWRHLTLLRPRAIVTLGAMPTRALTGSQDTIRRLRGQWRAVAVPGLPQPVSTLPMYHPAYILRTPAAKKDAWADLVALRRHLNNNA